MAKIVFVTGASRGIGRGIALRFLDAGFNVAIGYCRNRSEGEKLCKQYQNAFPVQVDVQIRKSIQNAINKIRNYFAGEIDVLVNNAAIAQEKPFLKITDGDWDCMMAVNLRGPVIAIQEVLPLMLQKEWGRIINISSIGGQWGGVNQLHYAAAKAGLINLTRSIAKVYSTHGVTCNAVAPGLIATDMAANELGSDAGQEKVKGIPAGCIGTVEDVASAVYYLASGEASYVTGQTLNVNGGMYFG